MMSGLSDRAEPRLADTTNSATSARSTLHDDDDDELAVEASIPSSPTIESGGGLGEYNSAGTNDKVIGEPSSVTGARSSVTGARHAECKVRSDIDMDGGLGEGLADERQCRICFSGAEEEPSMGKLISPCLCSGSMRVS